MTSGRDADRGEVGGGQSSVIYFFLAEGVIYADAFEYLVIIFALYCGWRISDI